MKYTRSVLELGAQRGICLANNSVEAGSEGTRGSVLEASIPTGPSLLHASFISVVSILMFFLVISSSNADEFGRLFTTPKQRMHLDELRKVEPKAVVEVIEEEIIIEEEIEEIPVDTITVKGLVFRSGGKSTAWINDSNTYEGNVA